MKNKKILIIDIENKFLKKLRNYVRNFKITFDSTNDILKALELIKEYKYSIILNFVNSKNKDSLNLISKILFSRPKTNIIAISYEDSFELREEVFNQGAYCLIPNFDNKIIILKQLINQLLNKETESTS